MQNNIHITLSHFTFWISLSLSEIAKHTHRPQGVNYHVYFACPQIFVVIILKQNGVMQTIQIDK